MKSYSIATDLIYPKRCVFCREYLPIGTKSFLCHKCEENEKEYFYDGKNTHQFIDKCISHYVYKDNIKRAIISYKFHGKKSYSSYFACVLAEKIEELDWAFDEVTFVPLGAERKWGRGYNQSEIIALEVAKLIGKPCKSTLKKKMFTKRQASLPAKKRKANVFGKFKLNKKTDICGKTLLLIDDVLTTGSTVSECARVLKTGGANKVYCLTLAKTIKS